MHTLASMVTLRHVALVLSTVGLIDAAYLSYARATHSALNCSILNGCNIVAASPYAVLFSLIPLAYLGLLFYTALVVMLLTQRLWEPHLWRLAFFALAGGGAVASVYFLYVQFFLIRAVCIYCLLSAGISFALCGVAYLLLRESDTAGAEHGTIA